MDRMFRNQAIKSNVSKIIRDFADNSLLIRYLIIDYRQGKWAPTIAASNLQECAGRNESIINNLKLQKEIRQVFSPYHHLCQRCQDCCKIDIPFYRIDCILYGWNPNNPFMVPQTNLTKIIKKIILLPYKMLKKYALARKEPALTNIRDKSANACVFLTHAGCRFPWGSRPTFCVLFLCYHFIFEMSWRDFARYIRLSHKYLHHLSRSARLIVNECRRQSPGLRQK